MSDQILETAIAFVKAMLENPFIGPMVVGFVRNITGWIQTKWVEKTGKSYDKAIVAGTLTKYLVAVNAVSALLPMEYAYALTLIADIGFSAVKKLKNGK